MKLTSLSNILEAFKMQSSKREVPSAQGHYRTDTVVEFAIQDDQTGGAIMNGAIDHGDYHIKWVNKNAASKDIYGALDVIMSNDHRRGISVGASTPDIKPYLDQLKKDGKLNSAGRPTKKYYEEYGVDKYKNDQLGLDYMPTSGQTKNTKALPPHATNSISAALAYHKKMFNGKRWKALEDAFMKRAPLITNPKGGDYVRPRTSVFNYMDQLTERWPDGEELIKSFLLSPKARDRDRDAGALQHIASYLEKNGIDTRIGGILRDGSRDIFPVMAATTKRWPYGEELMSAYLNSAHQNLNDTIAIMQYMDNVGIEHDKEGMLKKIMNGRINGDGMFKLVQYMDKVGVAHDSTTMLDPYLELGKMHKSDKEAIGYMTMHGLKSKTLLNRALAVYEVPTGKNWDELSDEDFEETGDQFKQHDRKDPAKGELLQYLNQVYGYKI